MRLLTPYVSTANTMLALLTRLLTDVFRVVALVPVRAVAAVAAGKEFADACVPIAVPRWSTRVKVA